MKLRNALKYINEEDYKVVVQKSEIPINLPSWLYNNPLKIVSVTLTEPISYRLEAHEKGLSILIHESYNPLDTIEVTVTQTKIIEVEEDA